MGEAPRHVDTVDSVGVQLKIAKAKFTEVGKLYRLSLNLARATKKSGKQACLRNPR